MIYIFFWFFFLCAGIFLSFLHSHRLKPVFTVAYSIRHYHSPPQQREITAVVWMYALSSSSHSCISHLTFLSIKWHAYSSSSSNAYSKNTLSYTYFCYTSIHSHPELTFQWKTLSALFLGALLVISSGGYWLLALKVTS